AGLLHAPAPRRAAHARLVHHRHPRPCHLPASHHHQRATGRLGRPRLPALARPPSRRLAPRRHHRPPRQPHRHHRLHHRPPRPRRLHCHLRQWWRLAGPARPHPTMGHHRSRLAHLATPPPTPPQQNRHHRPPQRTPMGLARQTQRPHPMATTTPRPGRRSKALPRPRPAAVGTGDHTQRGVTRSRTSARGRLLTETRYPGNPARPRRRTPIRGLFDVVATHVQVLGLRHDRISDNLITVYAGARTRRLATAIGRGRGHSRG